MLNPGSATQSLDVLHCLRRLGTDAAELLPEVEALSRIPTLHFDVVATARVLRGEAPAEPKRTPSGPGIKFEGR